ncbi:MAG: SCP2 sterol-binding domain-containing protein [Bacillota bacterium]
MPFPYRDPEQARPFLLEYFELTKTDPELLEAWKNLGMVVGVKIEDLGLGYTLDCTSGRDVVVLDRYPEEPPGCAMKLNADVFHDIFTGRLNVMMAFGRRLVRTEGNIAGIMKLSFLLPKNIKLYKDYIRQKGLSS